MKNKYIKFFKKELIFLLVLLIVVFVSFGITFANFIYNSDNKRAVEMFAGALSYNIKINDLYQNNIELDPGSHIINIEIESTNDIGSYYKLLTSSDLNMYSLEGLTSGLIASNEKTNIKLYVINNKNEKAIVSFIVSMGYLTNTLDDVIVKDGYNEISKIKNEITFDNKQWYIKRVNNDTSIDLISKDVYTTKLSGYKSYNDLNNLLNSKCTTINSSSIDVFDIEGINILTDSDYTFINRLVYYPSIIVNREDIIADSNNSGSGGYYYSNSIALKNKSINYNKNNNILNDKKYVLNTLYYEINNNEINYYVIEMDNGNIIARKLYDSNNTNYEVTTNVRCKVTIKDVVF